MSFTNLRPGWSLDGNHASGGSLRWVFKLPGETSVAASVYEEFTKVPDRNYMEHKSHYRERTRGMRQRLGYYAFPGAFFFGGRSPLFETLEEAMKWAEQGVYGHAIKMMEKLESIGITYGEKPTKFKQTERMIEI